MLIQDRSKQLARLAAILGLLAAVAGIVLAVMLAGKHSGFIQSDLGCTIDGQDGCKNLGASPDSRIFFGRGPHIAWFGLFFYLSLGGLFLRILLCPPDRRAALAGLLLAMTVFGTVYDGFLAYKNLFVFEVPCQLCIYTYFATLVALLGAALLAFDFRQSPAMLAAGEVLRAALRAWYVFAAAFLICLGLALYFTVALRIDAAGGEGRDSRGGIPLLGVERRAGIIAEHEALPIAPQLNVNGLTQFEGPANAPIVIQEFADFRCPHCYHASEELRYLQQRWPDRLRVYYRHFPLDATCNPQVSQSRGGYSCNGAQAALCASEQNIFPKIYHGIFNFQATEQNIGLRELENLTVSAGGSWPRLLQCMGSAATQQRLNRDLADALAVKVEATPTLIIQGRLFRGAPPIEWITAVIDALVLQKEGAAAEADFAARNPL
ncbi:MAG: thioredoxin domain-containing protein [Leptospirales bacterium]|nr:thioredoxin domain-containing protein [Leptospirales bacterium]